MNLFWHILVINHFDVYNLYTFTFIFAFKSCHLLTWITVYNRVFTTHVLNMVTFIKKINWWACNCWFIFSWRVYGKNIQAECQRGVWSSEVIIWKNINLSERLKIYLEKRTSGLWQSSARMSFQKGRTVIIINYSCWAALVPLKEFYTWTAVRMTSTKVSS